MQLINRGSMMKSSINYLTSILLLAVLSAPSLADNSKHRVGLELGSGSAKYKSSSDDGGGVGTSYLYYNYQFMPMFSVEAGISGAGELDKWRCTETEDTWTCKADNKPIFNINADQLEVGSLVLSLRADYPLTQRNSLYGKLGIQNYDYEFSRKGTIIADDSGMGMLISAGWKYQWDMGLSLNAGLQHSKMGDLSFTTTNLGISYAF